MNASLPWFEEKKFPVYLAPMAGVTDTVFRSICKEFGADVLVTEFVSADGILHRNKRTREYLEFSAAERPLGVQLFGADPDNLARAASEVVDWVAPDFIDLNFGCPVNKVVCRNGGSALLKDCPLLEKVTRAVATAVAPLPVTAKIRIGWSQEQINACETAKILEQCGVRALAVHGRTRAQGYSGKADWKVIGKVKQSVAIPVIGNGDISSPKDVSKRRTEAAVDGVMIGRAAMSAPWIFAGIKEYLVSGRILPPPDYDFQWDLVRRHCESTILRCGNENHGMRIMRGRLMAYSKGMPAGKFLRNRFAKVASLPELDAIREDWAELPASRLMQAA